MLASEFFYLPCVLLFYAVLHLFVFDHICGYALCRIEYFFRAIYASFLGVVCDFFGIVVFRLLGVFLYFFDTKLYLQTLFYDNQQVLLHCDIYDNVLLGTNAVFYDKVCNPLQGNRLECSCDQVSGCRGAGC